MYYGGQGGILSAVSDDGLVFTREWPVFTGFVEPAVVMLTDGSYMMLAVAFSFGPGGKLTDASPGIYSFISQDGINFEGRKLVLAGEGKRGNEPVRAENACPAIIDKETFRKVQDLMKGRVPVKVHPRRASSPFLLSDLAYCDRNEGFLGWLPWIAGIS
ncbi:hypothetical protein ACFLW1_01865 [Chloroflexota bacterium]